MNCLQFASKIKITCLFAFLRTHLLHELVYSLPLLFIWCIQRVPLCVLLMHITHFALFFDKFCTDHELWNIANIVWLSYQITKYRVISCGSRRKISLRGGHNSCCCRPWKHMTARLLSAGIESVRRCLVAARKIAWKGFLQDYLLLDLCGNCYSLLQLTRLLCRYKELAEIVKAKKAAALAAAKKS